MLLLLNKERRGVWEGFTFLLRADVTTPEPSTAWVQEHEIRAHLQSSGLRGLEKCHRASPKPFSTHLGQKNVRGHGQAGERGGGTSLRSHLLLLAARAVRISH